VVLAAVLKYKDMKKIIDIALFLLLPFMVMAQSDTSDVKTLINANFPDNISGYITPARLREVSTELMRSNANMLERSVFTETIVSGDSVKSDAGFFKWNGVDFVEIGSLSDTALWVRSGGYITPVEANDVIHSDSVRIGKLVYPSTATVDLGAAVDPFDLLFVNAIDGFPTSFWSFDDSLYYSGAVSIWSDLDQAFGIVGSSKFRGLVDVEGTTNTTAIMTVGNTAGDIQVFRTDATPEGSVTGSIGDLVIDGTGGKVYVKRSGAATNTGWKAMFSQVQMGECYSEAETTITGSGTAKTLVDNTTTLSGNSMGDWDVPSDGRLRYTGTKTLTFHTGATISFKTTAGNNQQIEVEVRKNGTKVTGSKVLSTGDNTEYHSTAIHVFAQMETNDYLELFVINNTGSNEVVVNSFNLFTMSLE